MQKTPLYLLLCLMFWGCQAKKINIGEASTFYPPPKQLYQGIAYKYYSHEYPHDKNKQNSTDIEYRSYQMTDSETVVEKIYDAGMTMRWRTIFRFDNNQVKALDKYLVFRGDTMMAEIGENIEFDWGGKEVDSEYSITNKNGYRANFTKKQVALSDTIVDGLECKLFQMKRNTLRISPEQDSTTFKADVSYLFAKNKGMYAIYTDDEENLYHTELIEQMSLAEFEKRANNGKKRRAYIDPSQTLDDHSDFKLCNPELQIGDYYNCSQPAQLRGGKGTWWRVLKKELSPSLLHNESGFLTYRFVLNCEAKAGRFITEQADLNYNEKQFNPETVKHLYNIVSTQKDWLSCQTKEPRIDAYTYITFKLKDGKIIDLLP